jgi:hypothetical protein
MQPLHTTSQTDINRAFAREKGGAFTGRFLKRQRKQGFFAGGVHGVFRSTFSAASISAQDGARQIRVSL